MRPGERVDQITGEIDAALHYNAAIQALPDFAALVYSEIEKTDDPGRIAELEESIVMYEEWIQGRTLFPTL